MNYDLAMMALEGLARAPIRLRTEGGEVILEAEQASFKELARLCLLLGGVQSAKDEFELSPGVHVSSDSPKLVLRIQSS
ncbi:MAG TPA: hypothetical protein VEK57_16190 [Thermoanaerobaculia bacterium]|nr:hypothetical protein [Thermoanaerobaculia bacterium]